MKNNFLISEEEKNRILGLHKKQVLIERSPDKELLGESEVKQLLREQQEKEVEMLLNSLSENDPPEKWQKIIDKAEEFGDDVVTFIRKMKDKEMGKKFGRFLKKNFNKVKFKQAGDKVVSFFNKLTGKQPTTTATVVEPPTPTPTPTPEPEDPNSWKFDFDKRKEWLLKNGYTEETIKSFIGKRSGSLRCDGQFNINSEYCAVNAIFEATYYEPISDTENIQVFNMPKTNEQFFQVIQTYGFEPIDPENATQVKKYFPILPYGYYNEYGISKFIAGKKGWQTYNFKNMYGNPKTKVVTWYEDANKSILMAQCEFTNNKTDQKTTFVPDYFASFPLIGSDSEGEVNDIDIDVFKNFVLNPEIVQFEDYEDNESIQNMIYYVRSWWAEDDGKGESRYYNSNGKVYYKSDNREFTDAQSALIRQGVKMDFDVLENKINKHFQGEELAVQLKKLEDLKNEAKNIKLYE